MSESTTKFTALVVDDEDLVREVTSLILEENGATVFSAADGEEALAIFKEHLGKIDIVYLDFSMPRMNGYETFVEMRKIFPKVGFVMGSGLAISQETAQAQKEGLIEFIDKPFQEIELMRAVRNAMSKFPRD